MPSLPLIASFDELGGPKTNASSLVDPTTDLDASADNLARYDTAQMSRMSPRAYLRMVWTGSVLTVLAFDSVWGSDASYTPSPSRVSTGIYPVSFPAQVPDGFGGLLDLNLRAGWVNLENSNLLGNVEVVAPNIISVRIYNTTTATVADPTNKNIVIFLI